MSIKSNVFLFFLLGFCLSSLAQSERKITRNGNSDYETGNFVDAEINYKKAIQKNPNLMEAQFNLGDALAKQERYDEALASFDLVSSSSNDPSLRANALHNKGNVLLSKQDLQGATEAYKEALRINPKDEETRYNYAYTKKLLEQQQEQQEQNKDNQNQEQNQDDQNQNQDGSENKDQKDSKGQDEQEEKQDSGDEKENDSDQENQNNGQTDGEESDENQSNQQPKPRENKLSPEEAQRLLDALSQQEDQVQDKMKKHQLKGAKLKIEKDW